MELPTQIRKVVSVYQGIKVYDIALLRYVGIDTYSTLRRLSPDLYQNFIECRNRSPSETDQIHRCPSQIEVEIVDSGLTSLQIKAQLLALFTNANNRSISNLVQGLPNSSTPPGRDMMEPPMATVWWIIILFIIISSIVGALYVLGAIDALITPRQDALYRFVAVPPTREFNFFKILASPNSNFSFRCFHHWCKSDRCTE